MALFSGKAKKERDLRIREEKERLNAINPKFIAVVHHVYGLPAGDGAICKLYYKDDIMIFEINNNSFNLETSKVMDITVKGDNELRTQFTSSVGAAIAGGFLLGPVGAAIGGRTKKKQYVERGTFYMIVTYCSDNKTKQIALDITNDPDNSVKISQHFRNTKTERTEFNL